MLNSLQKKKNNVKDTYAIKSAVMEQIISAKKCVRKCFLVKNINVNCLVTLGNCGNCPNIGIQKLYCYCGKTFKNPPIPCGT